MTVITGVGAFCCSLSVKTMALVPPFARNLEPVHEIAEAATQTEGGAFVHVVFFIRIIVYVVKG